MGWHTHNFFGITVGADPPGKLNELTAPEISYLLEQRGES